MFISLGPRINNRYLKIFSELRIFHCRQGPKISLCDHSVAPPVSLISGGLFPSQASFVSRSWWNAAMETLVLGGCSAGLAYEIGAAMAILVKGLQ